MDLSPLQAKRLFDFVTDFDATQAVDAAATVLAYQRSADAPLDETDHPNLVGRTIHNYRIERTLGRGGMGEVYVARDMKLDREVALKSIRPEHRYDRSLKQRFLTEARVLSSLDHPNICRVFDYVETPGGDFIVLELINGVTLGDAIGRGLADRDKLQIAESLAEALRAAHGAGVIHRDLKPDNVMLLPTGEVKILDFGLARTNFEADGDMPDDANVSSAPRGVSLMAMTAKGRIMGTPLYMSPEQAQGEVVTAASDMYSLGLVLQHLFSETEPYADVLDLETLLEHARVGRTRPIAHLKRDVRELVRQLCRMEPTERPTAAETRDRLRRILDKPRRRLRNTVIAAVAGVVVTAGALGAAKYTIDLQQERQRELESWGKAESMAGVVLDEVAALLPASRLDLLSAPAEAALAYYDSVPERHLDDETIHRRAQSLQLLGRVRASMVGSAAGDDARTLREEGEQAFQQSIDLGEAVVQRNPDRADWLRTVGDSQFYIGLMHMELMDFDAALERFEAYRAVADRLAAIEPDNPKWRLEQAYAHTNLAATFQRSGNLDAALEQGTAGLAIKRELLEHDPADLDLRRSIASGLSWEAEILWGMGPAHRDAARRAFADELLARESIVESPDADWNDRYMLATCLANAGGSEANEVASLEHYLASRRLGRELVDYDPTNVDWQRHLGVVHREVGKLRTRRGQYDQAASELRASLNLLDGLVASDPERLEWRWQRSYAQGATVSLLLAMRRDPACGVPVRLAVSCDPFGHFADEMRARAIEDLEAIVGGTEDWTTIAHQVQMLSLAYEQMSQPRYSAAPPGRAGLALGRAYELNAWLLETLVDVEAIRIVHGWDLLREAMAGLLRHQVRLLDRALRASSPSASELTAARATALERLERLAADRDT